MNILCKLTCMHNSSSVLLCNEIYERFSRSINPDLPFKKNDLKMHVHILHIFYTWTHSLKTDPHVANMKIIKKCFVRINF